MNSVERFEVREVGDVTVARFRDPRVTSPMEIEELGQQLYRILEYKNCGKLVLDFEMVEFLSSATLGKLISLNRKAKLCKAGLRLCNLRPAIRELFRLCNLERVFDVRESLAAAMASFA